MVADGEYPMQRCLSLLVSACSVWVAPPPRRLSRVPRRHRPRHRSLKHKPPYHRLRSHRQLPVRTCHRSSRRRAAVATPIVPKVRWHKFAPSYVLTTHVSMRVSAKDCAVTTVLRAKSWSRLRLDRTESCTMPRTKVVSYPTARLSVVWCKRFEASAFRNQNRASST